MAPFSVTLRDPCPPGFKVTALFDADYLRNGARYSGERTAPADPAMQGGPRGSGALVPTPQNYFFTT